MSTTFKRVALVAVASLTLGFVSVAPSQAAGNANLWVEVADGVSDGAASTDGNAAGGAVAGPYNSMQISALAFGAGDVVELTGGTIVSSTNSGVLNTAKTAVVLAAGTSVLTIATPTVGTITAKLYKNTAGVVSTTASETVVVTVAAAALSGTYNAAKSPIYLVAGETFTATADATTTPSKVKTYVATDSATASIVVYSKDALGVAVTNDTFTATITSGPGTLATAVQANGQYDSVTAYAKSSDDSLGTYSVSARPDSSGRAAFFIYANGQAGNSTITIRNSAGTILSTKTVSFSDTTIASITATVLKNYVQGDAATATTNVIKLTLKDAAGNAISSPAAYPTVTSSSTTLGTGSQTGAAGVADTATANASGEVFWGFTPAAAASYGPVTLTFTAGLVSTTATITLSSAKAATASVSALAVNAGDAVNYVVTLKDAKGYAIPDGLAFNTYASAIATTGGIATAIDAPASTVKSVNGTFTTAGGIAPLVSTTLTTTITLSGTVDTADSQYVATLAGTKLVGTATVSNPSADAAIDAANEAAQAASDATDAALAAADAADAATTKAQEAVDAVATLSAQVSKLITALKAQITTLTNLVIKIQKKVRA